ncbi:chorion peroxidase [Bicyclus anynana]|uniref:Chorion peroxidase n=1 Tax=Bicyclus anynana TaxID=110368 RepID=A0ABM3LKZ9_BICAN|nr:chorion peroxidase [Bicyclus anynana]
MTLMKLVISFVKFNFIFIALSCIRSIVSEPYGTSLGGHYGVNDLNEHVHSTEAPCDVCPRHGVCVPPVQCPAHVRPGARNPRCHLETQIGVCCFTGVSHAGKYWHRKRSNRASINVEDVKAAHNQSRRKLQMWLLRAEGLQKEPYAVVNVTSPSYGHHLSLVTYDERAQRLGRGALLNLFAAQELKSRQALTDDELALRFTDHTDGPYCPPNPPCPEVPSKYRSVDGNCNNKDNPSWGGTHTGYGRLLAPSYSDGVWAIRISASGEPLPSARAVSTALILDGNHPSSNHNLLFMQFGQFVAHDISTGVVYTLANGKPISCCDGNGEAVLPPEMQHWACAPIVLDEDDVFYGQFKQRCINFVRTQLAPDFDCSVGYATQMNGASHYPDLSHLYGSSVEKMSQLRAPGGLLAVFNDYGRELPPLTHRKECLNVHDGAACFESGDNHGNQVISLTVLHTIWTREHNKIARALSALNPGWDEDTVFMETRRIVLAEFQHIIYNEWLPLLLGSKIMQMYGLTPSAGYALAYDPETNPSLSGEFATAAMRFGHSVVDSQLTVLSRQRKGVYESISLPEVMFQPSRLRIKPFLDRLLLGLMWRPMQSVDPFVTEALSRYMFHGGNPYGLDLAAINVQRGRDYGIRSYNDYRKLVGLQPLADFHQLAPSAARRLSSVYASPDDIDLWVGGLLEEPVEGGIIGTTFANIIADQFTKLKRGDRYYYEYGPDVNPGAFTPSQLAEIKKVTLSRILCDNSDGIEISAASPNAFFRSVPGNEPVPCDSPLIAAMDLSKFKE